MRLFLALLLAAELAIADDGAIRRCRAVTDPVARLACYDALVVPPVASVINTESVAGKAVSPTAAGLAASPAGQKSNQFGLEEKIASKNEVDAIESQITGSFEGWTSRSNIRLANGQVWQIVDNSSRAHYIENPTVRIRRGALGSFYLEIQGTNYSPRVKRVQ